MMVADSSGARGPSASTASLQALRGQQLLTRAAMLATTVMSERWVARKTRKLRWG